MTADERRLLRLYRALPLPRRESLFDYLEFMLSRTQEEAPTMPEEPLDLPRPAQESVVKAIKRLRETYPMLDRAKILHEASGLMTQHLMNGRPAAEVINELETIFQRHFQSTRGD